MRNSTLPMSILDCAFFVQLSCMMIFYAIWRPGARQTVAAHAPSCQSQNMGKKIANCAIIVAAGRGSRAGQEFGPKQYQMLGRRTVLARTLQKFIDHTAIDAVVVVIHADDRPLYETAAVGMAKLLPCVVGGETRQISVAAGLDALAAVSPQRVLIHDAARPFVDADLISSVLEALDNHQAAIPALAVAETLKHVDQSLTVTHTVPRENLYAAQTPQGFQYSQIAQAHSRARSEGLLDFTDDSAIAEWAGMDVVVLPGTPENKKLTTRQDMETASNRFDKMALDVRVGHGYDTHQFVDGDAVWLCGVKVPHNRALDGHSDADVGLHALTDALLATIADGDIGDHFPPGEEQWRDASSDRFLRHAVDRVEAQGGTITHLDVTLVCETPKIGPHRLAMRQAIAAISGIATSRISVKATTNERIGFVGRTEGMVALATATVVMGDDCQ